MDPHRFRVLWSADHQIIQKIRHKEDKDILNGQIEFGLYTLSYPEKVSKDQLNNLVKLRVVNDIGRLQV